MKTVLITGAGSGFGLNMALHLAKEGYRVIATMRNLEKRELLCNLARGLQLENRIYIRPMDITKEEEVLAAEKWVEEHFGGIDILINNAGYAQCGFFEEISMEEWRRQFETNLFGHIFVTKSFLPLLRKKESGKIINISSISGYFGFPGLGPYIASKHALEGWSESLRLELVPEGIWVSLVEPASFKTGIWEKGLEKISEGNRTEFQRKILKKARMAQDKGGDPEQVSRLIAKICEKKRPKLRYPIGKGTRLVYILKSILPFSLIEKAVYRMIMKNE